MSSLRIVTRAQWGARPFVRPRQTVPITSRRYFVVHYPGAGTPPSEVTAYAKWMERIHIDQNGWSGVGYNAFVSHGVVAEGCGRDIVGSHSPPRNRDGLGVNIWTSNGQPRDEDLAACRDLYELWSAQAGRRLIMTYHGEHYATECPGSTLRSWVKAGMPYPKGYDPTGPDRPKPGAGGDTATPRPIPTDPEDIDMGAKEDLQAEIDSLRKIVEARTNPNVTAKDLDEAVKGARLALQRTAPYPSKNGPVEHRTAAGRGIAGYEWAESLQKQFVALNQRLSQVTAGNADEIRRILSDFAGAVQKVAEDTNEKGN